MQTAAHGRAGVANWQLMHEGRWAKLVLESYYGERSDQLKWANNSPEIEIPSDGPCPQLRSKKPLGEWN